MSSWRFAKGHGTGNDFILLVGSEVGAVTAQQVRFLCDRRIGVGGDGILRAVRAGEMPEWRGDPGLWFMDYRNSDGSLAEMCGNGLRVFTRYLLDEGLAVATSRPGEAECLDVATRAGLRRAWPLADGQVRLSMGPVVVGDEPAVVSTSQGRWRAWPVNVGNPHLVTFQDKPIAALDLSQAPTFDPASYPQGSNVEFVNVLGDHYLQLRVFERGSGETYSCGTGVVATAAAQARRMGEPEGTWTVDVPGGRLHVEITDGQAYLTGPAMIVARGDVEVPDQL